MLGIAIQQIIIPKYKGMYYWHIKHEWLQMHYAKWKDLDTQAYILYGFIEVKL